MKIKIIKNIKKHEKDNKCEDKQKKKKEDKY
jgi:hypothetical protein